MAKIGESRRGRGRYKRGVSGEREKSSSGRNDERRSLGTRAPDVVDGEKKYGMRLTDFSREPFKRGTPIRKGDYEGVDDDDDDDDDDDARR